MNLNELHQAAQRGETTAETRLFEILTVRFRRFAYQRVWNEETAREVAQDALAVVAREYRELQAHTSFAAWAHQVLEYRLLALYRAEKTRRNREQLGNSEHHPKTGQEPSPALKVRLMDCLRKLVGANRRYARVLNLRYQGYKTADICDRLRITSSNCYVMLSRARDTLERCLEGEATDK